MKAAYSYIRFSTPDQIKGDSFRRQTEKADEWARENGYQIVDVMADLGVSAFRGKNAKEGRLADFLALVQESKITPGSVLIVESLDRFSRSTVRQVLPDFLKIINEGIGVVTLTDKRLYTTESLDKDNFQLLASLIVMTRAHEESETKSKRISDVWKAKRKRAQADPTEKLTDRVPAWLNTARDPHDPKKRIFTENKDRARVVRRIFEETAQGYGRRAIVKRLNERKELTFRSVRGWQPSTVAKIIRSREVLGEYLPHVRDEGGRRVRHKEIPVIKNYYPKIIDEGLWTRANAAVDIRRKGAAGRPQAEAANLIRGLARCRCGSRMEFVNKGRPPKGGRYYVCSSAARRAGCEITRAWKCELVENALLYQLGPRGLEQLSGSGADDSVPSIQEYEARVEAIKLRRQKAYDALMEYEDRDKDGFLRAQLQKCMDDLDDAEKQLDAAIRAERQKPDLPTTQNAINAVAEFGRLLQEASDEERIHIRRMIMQQLRAAFCEVRFSKHTIVVLIALPGKPWMKTTLGIPRPIEVQQEGAVERYYLRHLIYTDNPEYLEEISNGEAEPGAASYGNRYTDVPRT